MKYFLVPITTAVAALFLFAGGSGLQAQPLENLLYTAGTTTTNLINQHWSYLLWLGSSADLVKGRAFAVYSKLGEASTAGLYTRRSILHLQTDPAVLQVLLNRSLNLGQDPAKLEEHLNNLFQKLMPPAGAMLSEKLSIVIRSSLADPAQFNNLILMSRQHPAVALSLGIAYTEAIPPAGKVTYELRQWDPGKESDLGVVGRVTVQAGAPIILPAPGAPVLVPDFPANSAKGDLNAKLRWALPADLRRFALMNHGFNVYRVATNFAVAHQWHSVPPLPNELADYARQFGNNLTNPPVRRVNEAPIIATKLFDAATAANFDTNSPAGDATTHFTHDDNRRYEPGGLPFRDGETFYYFVAGRDILGRDGAYASGTKVQMCDRLPPNPPQQIKVENDYTKLANVLPKQVLKITWHPNLDTLTDSNAYYWVFRWTNHSDYLRDRRPVDLSHPNLVAAPVLHVPGIDTLALLDQGALAPQMPQDAGKTFWYTIRVQDKSTCGNFSPHSGPSFGVLRDRVGPAGPNGSLAINCCQPETSLGQNSDSVLVGADPMRAHYRPFCDRLSPAIEWAEFYLFAVAPSNRLTRLHYFGNSSRVTADYSLSRDLALNTNMTFYCRVGSVSGKISTFRLSATGVPAVGTVRNLGFAADLVCQTILLTGKRDLCAVHNPKPPGAVTNDCVDLLLTLAPGTREVKVYRRVDFGPLMLIDQISNPTNSLLTVQDCTLMANPADVCYFAQAFDEHGNASAMVAIGDCLKISGTTSTPQPVLSPLIAEGNAGNPLLQIRWSCPPYGVDHFEVSIAMEGDAVMPTNLFPALSALVRVDPDVAFKIKGTDKTDQFSVYASEMVSALSEGEFYVIVPIQLFKTYYVFVRAVGKDGETSPRSNAEDFTWTEPTYQAPQVPWPDRPMPNLGDAFSPRMIATNLNHEAYPVGIRIGEHLPVVGFTAPTNGHPILQGLVNPVSYLFEKNGKSVFPVALYRLQVTNANFPKVSGDLTQVSPLMERMATQPKSQAPWGLVTVIHDPFVMVLPTGVPGATGPRYDLYLLDTQPVIEGARYRYYLVRFAENREIEEVIPSNEVEL